MKKLYSTILLFSFLIGTIQPALPLIEYHIFKESIIERFCVNRELPESDCDGVCYLTSQIQESEKDEEPVALNMDYYPIGAEYIKSFSLQNPVLNQDRFPALCEHKIPAESQPNAPPPKKI